MDPRAVAVAVPAGPHRRSPVAGHGSSSRSCSSSVLAPVVTLVGQFTGRRLGLRGSKEFPVLVLVK